MTFGTEQAYVEQSAQAVRVLPNGFRETSMQRVSVEHALEVSVNGHPLFKVACSRCELFELVAGRLRTEGLIDRWEKVLSIRFSDDQRQAWVELDDSVVVQSYLERRGPVPVLATHGSDDVVAIGHEDLDINSTSPMMWALDDIFSLAREFEGDAPGHKSTYGMHSCRIAKGGKTLFCCEDLGRHNAFDKAVGKALIEGVDLRECIVFTSGRVPIDMMGKVVRAGIPVLVSKAVPTNQTIGIAKRFGLTLICSAHSDAIVVYNDSSGCCESQTKAV